MKFIRRLYAGFDSVPPIFLDGLLVILITLLTFWGSVFGGDEAAKYIAPWLIFWLKNIFGGLAITLVALQSFRSKLFAQHVDAAEKKKIADDTATTLEEHPEGLTTQQTVTEQTTVVTEQKP